MWKQDEARSKEKERAYVNSQTHSELITDLIYTDYNGNKWWGFRDLYTIPSQRRIQAETVTNLFQINLTKEDFQTWINKEKELLRGNDKEKYEKLYALVLEKEAKLNTIADPVVIYMSIACLYILADDERIDWFTNDSRNNKMAGWAEDPAASAFFLTWLLDRTAPFGKVFAASSLTASKDSLKTDPIL